MKNTGIISYGTAVPLYRIASVLVAKAWKKDAQGVLQSLMVKEKSVPGLDEDTVTLAVEAASQSLLCFTKLDKINALLVGSESHPYAVNPTATIVGSFLGIGNNYFAADLEFACKAGSAGIQLISGLVDAGQIEYGLAIGSDTAQSKPADALEYTSGAGAAAFLVGKGCVVAKLLAYTSYSSDTPDFWRRDGMPFPSHAGRFSGEPAYFSHILRAAKLLMKKTKVNIADISWCVFHMPNGRFPRLVAQRLGFSQKQLAPSLIVDDIGNPYSASSLLGLAAVLDIAKPGQLIFMVSYGSGAGSDAFLWQVTKEITTLQNLRKKKRVLIRDQIARKIHIDYTDYLRQTVKI